MAAGGASTLFAIDVIACPKCAARLTLNRDLLPLIDSAGFENYSFKCEQCGAELVGVIDPFDDRLLVSELER
jgi:DNA-directed RNA polymerase subunit RPC12/RpoP